MSCQVFGTRMVYRETFLQIQRRLIQHLIRKSQIQRSLMCQNTHHSMCWVKAKHQLRIRDASQDRQPEIQSSPVREDFWRIMVTERPTTTADFRSSFWQILHVNNVHLLEDKIQDWGMHLLTISYGSYGSQKWRWLNQWMISNLRVLSEELLVQTLSCSTRELLQHWTKSSRIPASRKRYGLINHRLKTMVKGSIEQNLRN